MFQPHLPYHQILQLRFLNILDACMLLVPKSHLQNADLQQLPPKVVVINEYPIERVCDTKSHVS
jgi:hypothetical protein